LSERFLKGAVKRHYKALGYKISMLRIRLGNTEVDGEAIGPQGERIAIEIKTPRDDPARGIGQLAEAIAFGYDKAVLAITFKNVRTIDDSVFKKFWIWFDRCLFLRKYLCSRMKETQYWVHEEAYGKRA